MKCKYLALLLVGLFLTASLAGVASAQVYKDPDAPIEDRVEDLLSQMTIYQKVEQMHGEQSTEILLSLLSMRTAPDALLGIPGIRFADGPRGVRWGNSGDAVIPTTPLDNGGPSTTFPVASARGATWNVELENRVGQVMGMETKAKGRDCLLAPTINIVRDPRGGRTQESFSEDTYLLGRMGVAFITGVQSEGAMAEAKHFAVNNFENSRQTSNAVIDERTLREVYLPHFEAAVKEANVASIMTAYNLVNGYYCAENFHLVREILKGEWGFDGYVVSDWLATNLGPIMRLQTDPEEIIKITPQHEPAELLAAGLDIEMPIQTYYGPALLAEGALGTVSEQLIDDAVRRILRKQFEFGLFDEERVIDPSKVETAESIQTALEAEQEGIVLLRNEGLLPLNLEELNSIAVIGPAANEVRLGGDGGSCDSKPSYAVTAYQGIINQVGDKAIVKYDSGSDANVAASAARDCDAAVVVVGWTSANEGEGGVSGGDRDSMVLPDGQADLISAVAKANPHTIVVLISGGAVVVNPWVNDVAAILMAWYPGMEGGNAIADVIFGDVNPSGKLPMTFPKSDEQLMPFDNNDNETIVPYYHGYRYFDKNGIEPQYPFGYGLSYTTFEFSNLEISEKAISPEGTVHISADVTNTGDVAGKEVAQLYIGYEGSAVDRPVKELKAFDKIYLEPGETKTVNFEIDAEDLGYWNTDKGAFETELIKHLVYVGDSSRDLPLTGSFIVGDEDEISEINNARTPGFEMVGMLAGLALVCLLARKRKA